MAENLKVELNRLVDELRGVRDELRVQVHLAGQDAAVAWKEEVEPRLHALEQQAAETGKVAVGATVKLAGDLRRAFEAFRGELGK